MRHRLKAKKYFIRTIERWSVMADGGYDLV
jgi:hypothetical protein